MNKGAAGKARWPRKKVAEIAQHSLGKMLDKAKNKGEPKPYFRNFNVLWFGFDLSDLLEMRFLPKPQGTRQSRVTSSSVKAAIQAGCDLGSGLSDLFPEGSSSCPVPSAGTQQVDSILPPRPGLRRSHVGEQYLRDFPDNEKSIPTILTTSQKLSTGVDARISATSC